MNWLIKSNQKLTRWLKKNRKPILVALPALMALTFLMGVLVGVPVRSLVGSLVGSLVSWAMAPLFNWAIARDIARLAALEEKENNGPRLILPPGAGLRDMLHFIYPPKTAERVFDQIIADMQLEWQEAMVKDQPWLARWVRVRGVLTVFLTAAVHVVATLGSILKLVR